MFLENSFAIARFWGCFMFLCTFEGIFVWGSKVLLAKEQLRTPCRRWSAPKDEQVNSDEEPTERFLDKVVARTVIMYLTTGDRGCKLHFDFQNSLINIVGRALKKQRRSIWLLLFKWISLQHVALEHFYSFTYFIMPFNTSISLVPVRSGAFQRALL